MICESPSGVVVFLIGGVAALLCTPSIKHVAPAGPTKDHSTVAFATGVSPRITATRAFAGSATMVAPAGANANWPSPPRYRSARSLSVANVIRQSSIPAEVTAASGAYRTSGPWGVIASGTPAVFGQSVVPSARAVQFQ